jgi:Ca2+-binding RTX toxin-like protein
VSEGRRRKRRFAAIHPALAGVVAIAGLGFLTCGGTPPPNNAPCNGTVLQGDPSGRPACPAPNPLSHACTPPKTQITHVAVPSTPTLEAEVYGAVDPRPGSKMAYMATIAATVQQGGTGPTGKCITSKTIQIYQSADMGGSWSLLPGTNALPQGMWVTDPGLAVGPDGTLYLSLMRTGSAPDCNHPPDFSKVDMEFWFAPPGGTLTPGLAPGASPFGDKTPSLANPDSSLDHPEIAVSPVLSDHRIAYYSVDEAQGDFITTLQPDGTGIFKEVNRLTINPGHGQFFAKLAFDASGDLYVATGTDGQGHAALQVQRRHWNGSDWSTIVTSGSPMLLGNLANISDIAAGSTGTSFFADPTPGLFVSALNGTSDPIVYLAYEIFFGDTRELQLEAANGTDLSRWTDAELVPLPSGALSMFHPSLSVDGTNNILDLVAYDLEGPAAGPLANIALNTYFYRFDAARFDQNPSDPQHVAVVLGPTLINQASPSVFDLPSRHSDATGLPSPFPGEYMGLATKGSSAIAGFPDLSLAPGAANVDLGLAVLGDSNSCASALTLSDPDSLWECACNCGATISVVGCASGSATTAAAACSQVCTGSICGAGLACSAGTCSGTSTGRILSAGSCAVAQGAFVGAPPASSADFAAAATSTSTAILHVGGQATPTSVGGQLFLNASTSPPTAGAVAEIARFDARPANVFVGGSVNAEVENISLVHRTRIRGVFTDATHFTVAPGDAEFVVTLQTGTGGIGDPDNPGGTLSAPVNIVAANPAPMTGTLDLTAGTISLDGTAGDNAGNSLELHFRSTITSRPADANHNGIIDTVDHCPGETVGPDRTPPAFTFVPPAMTITSCSGVNLGQAQATDPCGVTLTNDAPSKFPLGTTTVHWTAKDGMGNTAIATQQVTALLGDDVSCCPAGTHIIVGTSNNDVLTGTAGSDCILGLGGQDTISGLGGDDYISGGDGDDNISGGDGNDWLFGGTGQDVISGGAGNDVIYGGDGVDQLNGDDGNDQISGGQGGDVIHGGTGDDYLTGDADDDQIFGDDGNDTLVGGDGNDKLYGGAGNDSLFGQNGDDLLDGGTGTNTFAGGNGHNTCIDNQMTLPDEECLGDKF